jgi:hypothetical protein
MFAFASVQTGFDPFSVSQYGYSVLIRRVSRFVAGIAFEELLASNSSSRRKPGSSVFLCVYGQSEND